MGLATYKQIRFLPCMGTTGNFTLVINRPGYEDLSQPATDTLELGEGGEYYPFVVSGDFSLSKKFTTTRGRRALDDLNVGIRDGLSYTGEVNESPVSEDFTSSFMTFFDVWFNSLLPYKAFLLYTDNLTGATEVTHEGWIDPTYNPSSDAIVVSPLTSNQIWIGTRTIKITALAQGQINLTWGNVLQPYDAILNPDVPVTYAGIQAGDCQQGTPYNGYIMAPSALVGQSNTGDQVNKTTTGSLMQAVTYKQLDWTVNPAMVKEDIPAWPSNPWTSVNGIQNIASINLHSAGTGYAVNDTGTINTGTVLATYKILTIGGGGAVLTFELTSSGTGYSTGTNIGTTDTSGTGSGFTVDISKVGNGFLWGPSGLEFINLTSLFNKIALALGLTAFPTVKSALSFWRQLGGTNFPIDTSAAINVGDIYISMNVFGKSHPFDGSFWDNPVGWSPDTPVTEVLKSLCDMILADFNITQDSGGVQSLVLTPFGETSGSLPAWTLIGTPTQEEPATGARSVQVKYKADDLTIQCPTGIIGDTSSVEIMARIHRIGKTSGSDSLPDVEVLTFDSSQAVDQQADSCFKISWFNKTNGETTVNPDCWKSLCYLYWFHSASSNPGVYPTGWGAFDGTNNWTNSFFSVNAVTRAKNPDGTTFTPSSDLQSQIQGNDYFNLRDYPAVAFAALTLPQPTVQTLTFNGITDSSGSIQAIKSGLTKQWRYGAIANQNWVGIQIDQLLLGGETTIKFQQYPNTNGFPALTDLSYAPLRGGGTSSSTGSGTGGNSSGSTNPITNDVLTNPPTETRNDISGAAGLRALLHINGAFDIPLTTYTVSGTLIHDAPFVDTNGSQRSFIKLTGGSADFVIDSVVAGRDGCVMFVWNNTSFNATLGGSGGTAANRFSNTFYGNVTDTIIAGGSALFIYDASISRWRQIFIYPIPETSYDASLFIVTQSGTTGGDIVTINVSALATALGPYLTGAFVKTGPATDSDNTVQSSTADVVSLTAKQNASDNINKDKIRVVDSSNNIFAGIRAGGVIHGFGYEVIEKTETLLAGNNNNYTVDVVARGFPALVRIAGGAGMCTLTGINSSNVINPPVITFWVEPGTSLTVSGLDGNSVAANQFQFASGVINALVTSFQIYYSIADSKWIVLWWQ